MRKIMLLMVCAFMLIGCSSDKYSQKEQPFKLEVGTKKEDVDNNIKKELLKNNKALSESEIKDITLKYDEKLLKKLGNFEVKINNKDDELLTFKVLVQDTTKPVIDLKETEFVVGTKIEDKVLLSDNYDKEDILKKNIRIKGYDKKKEGEQEITISTMDSSKNEIVKKVKIILNKQEIEKETQSEANNSNSNANGGFANPSEGFVGNTGNSAGSSGSGSGGNSGGSSGGGWTPPPVVETPVAPPAACPGGMDPSLPCNWTPNNIGNTGLIFDTENALYAYAESKGWAGNTYQFLVLNYNDGSVKYSINKY